MARVQPSPFDISGGVPLGQWRAKGASFAALAALIVRRPLRKDCGLDLLRWSSIIIVAIALLALQWFDNLHVSVFTFFGGGAIYSNHTSLRNFALAWLALAVWEHFKRLDEEKRGVEPHTLWPGVSRLGLSEFLPLKPKIIAAAAEPALAFLAGAVLRRLGFSTLGWVIIVSAVCFSISEWRLWEQTKEHRRDVRNLAKEGLWESDLMKQSAEQKSRGFDASAGLATGIDGLEDSIGKRTEAGDVASAGGAL